MSARSYFSATISEFLKADENTIIGEMALQHPFDLNDLTKSSWLSEIRILKRELKDGKTCRCSCCLSWNCVFARV